MAGRLLDWLEFKEKDVLGLQTDLTTTLQNITKQRLLRRTRTWDGVSVTEVRSSV